MNTKKTPRLKLLLALVILSSCIGCDQATKTIATRTLADGPPKSFVADTIRLDYALNPGGFLSIGTNLPDNVRTLTFVVLNSCIMFGLVAFLCLKRNCCGDPPIRRRFAFRSTGCIKISAEKTGQISRVTMGKQQMLRLH